MHLSFEWNQIGWFTPPIKWHPFGHEAIGHEATKVTRWDQGATSVSVSYIDYLKRREINNIWKWIYDDFKKKQDWVLQTLKIAKSTSTFLIITLRGHCHNIL